MGLANTVLFTECSNHRLDQGGQETSALEGRGEKKKGKWEEREGSLITQSATHRIQSLESNKQVTHKQHTRQSRDERWSSSPGCVCKCGGCGVTLVTQMATLWAVVWRRKDSSITTTVGGWM